MKPLAKFIQIECPCLPSPLTSTIESRWHFIQAGEWNLGAEITLSLENYLTHRGYWQMSFQLQEEIANNGKELAEKNRGIVYHQLGLLYQKFGDYNKASSLAQMGLLCEVQNNMAEALKLLLQAFLIFTKLESPNAKKVRQYITLIREKMPAEQFEEILKKFNVVLETDG